MPDKPIQSPSTIISSLSEPEAVYGSILHMDLLHLIDKVRHGISFSVFSHIVSFSSFTWPDWSSFLHLSERSMQRYKKEQKAFDPLQSEKIVEISRLYQRGVEVFGSSKKFDAWLVSPVVALDGHTPKSFVDSSCGIQLINDELGRIEHGVLA